MPDDHAFLGVARIDRIIADGDPEVDQVRMVSRAQHVLGLEVAVDDARRVRCVERVRNVPQQLDALPHGNPPQSRQPVAQRLPFEMRHHVVEEAVHLARIDQRQDVRVGQLSGDAHLGEEALHAHVGGDLRVKHLEHDVPVVLVLARAEHRRAAAAAERPNDRVPLAQRLFQPRTHVRVARREAALEDAGHAVVRGEHGLQLGAHRIVARVRRDPARAIGTRLFDGRSEQALQLGPARVVVQRARHRRQGSFVVASSL